MEDPNLSKVGNEPSKNNEPKGNDPSENQNHNANEGVQPQQRQDDSGSTEDLLSRVTKFIDSSPKDKPEEKIDDDVFNDAEFRQKIDSIEDPELKQQMIRLRKSAITGVNTKFQEIAEIRKELESLKHSGGTQKWTPERIQQLINDPEFIQAASSVAGIGSDSDDDEYVPDSVKAKLKELDQIKSQLGQFQQQQTQAQRQQEHQFLQTKYGNYNPQRVDEIRKELLEGKVNATSEHIYKAWYHDENVKRAYEMGKRDAQKGISDNVNANSFDGNVQRQNQQIKPNEGESDKSFLKRIIEKNLAAKK